ncbi:hypothetical protein HS7_20990 [Sulfolobales archaeon HS-7]|nr:hypothetical protein HS7_20990 [Sulfolobales archaeon HS-7]
MLLSSLTYPRIVPYGKINVKHYCERFNFFASGQDLWFYVTVGEGVKS